MKNSSYKEGPRWINFTRSLLTGMSGAGKSQAVKVLEDIGYFCIDNLPPVLIPKFAELCVKGGERVRHVALIADIRGGQFFDAMSPGPSGTAQAGRFV